MEYKAIDIKNLKGRGKSLYIAVSQSGYSNKEAAEKAKYKENTFYSNIKKEFLDFKIMLKYARGIKHDFSNEYPEISNFQIENPLEQSDKETKAYLELQRKYTALLEKHSELKDKAEEKYNELKNKYDDLLEKYNKLKQQSTS